MILLLGGASDAPPLALVLAEAGYEVLISNATEVFQAIPPHPAIRRRRGALDAAGMQQLIQQEHIRLVVDATHPYAGGIKALAREVCDTLNLPCLQWQRPEWIPQGDFIQIADNHPEAAAQAAAMGCPILLTTGSRNLTPYVQTAHAAKQVLIARVLPHPDSVQACCQAGLSAEHIITGRGPFTLEQNLALMRRFGIGVLVSKNSGEAGGLPAKVDAARILGARLVLIRRPPLTAEFSCDNPDQLLATVRRQLS